MVLNGRPAASSSESVVKQTLYRVEVVGTAILRAREPKELCSLGFVDNKSVSLLKAKLLNHAGLILCDHISKGDRIILELLEERFVSACLGLIGQE